MAKTVLVVDDSSSFRTLVSMTLRNAGYDVVEAGDGQEGADKLDGNRFAMVICDLNMPRLDGFSFARQVKSSAAHKFIPILMLTTEAGDAKKAQGKAAGVSAWLSKPFQPSKLLYAVQSLCPT